MFLFHTIFLNFPSFLLYFSWPPTLVRETPQFPPPEIRPLVRPRGQIAGRKLVTPSSSPPLTHCVLYAVIGHKLCNKTLYNIIAHKGLIWRSCKMSSHTGHVLNKGQDRLRSGHIVEAGTMLMPVHVEARK